MVQKRLAEQHITLSLYQEVLQFIVERGHGPVYGARPLERAIQHEFKTPLSCKILADEVTEGSTVHVTTSPQGLVFEVCTGNNQ
jgi:ATP-dependent Clp protease ATP-binding subunit ClpB